MSVVYPVEHGSASVEVELRLLQKALDREMTTSVAKMQMPCVFGVEVIGRKSQSSARTSLLFVDVDLSKINNYFICSHYWDSEIGRIAEVQLIPNTIKAKIEFVDFPDSVKVLYIYPK